MEFEFDPAKDEANRRPHGVSLAFDIDVLANRIGESEDIRRAYGEMRMRAFGRVDGRLFACVYTRRGSVIRLISVHKVRPKEMDRWLAR